MVDITRLQDIREDRDLKQKEVAKVLGVTQQQYNKYELGINELSANKLCKLALFYNTSIDYLLKLTDERKPYPKSKNI